MRVPWCNHKHTGTWLAGLVKLQMTFGHFSSTRILGQASQPILVHPKTAVASALKGMSIGFQVPESRVQRSSDRG